MEEAEEFLIKNINNARLQRFLEGRAIPQYSWTSTGIPNSSNLEHSDLTSTRNISMCLSMIKRPRSFLYLLPNLVGDALVDRQYSNMDTSNGASQQVSGQATTAIQAARSLLTILNSRVLCKVCQERRKRTVTQSDEISSGSGSGVSSSDSSSGNGSGYTTLKTNTDSLNLQLRTIPVPVVRESGSGLSSGDALTAGSGKAARHFNGE